MESWPSRGPPHTCARYHTSIGLGGTRLLTRETRTGKLGDRIWTVAQPNLGWSGQSPGSDLPSPDEFARLLVTVWAHL